MPTHTGRTDRGHVVIKETADDAHQGDVCEVVTVNGQAFGASSPVGMLRSGPLLLASALLLAGCSGSDGEQIAPAEVSPDREVSSGSTPDISPPTQRGRSSCLESARVPPDSALAANSYGGQVWGLGGRPTAGEQFKLVVRVGGAGELGATAVAPSGERFAAEQTLFHPASEWDRPGEEWGTVFSIPAPGCWRFRVSRDGVVGEFTLWAS